MTARARNSGIGVNSMSGNLDVFDAFSRAYAREKYETMSLRDYLLAARDNPMMYATPAERMIAAIGRRMARSQFKRRPPVIAKLTRRAVNIDFRYPRDWGS